jgi:hypothetical protein
MVLQIKERSRFYWADQICIAQHRPRDKERQIPVMDTYFPPADAVLVWLGPSNTLIDLTLEMAEDVCASLANPKMVLAQVNQGRHPPGLPPPTHFFWHDLGDILMKEGFERLWSFQELFWGKAVRFYCGLGVVDLSTLFHRVYQSGMMCVVDPPGMDKSRRFCFPAGLHIIDSIGIEMPVAALTLIASRENAHGISTKFMPYCAWYSRRTEA